MTRIAIVGMAARYPDATSHRELWENAIAGRRAFRRLPAVRMNLDDYYDPDPTVPDRFYARNAAVIDGYRFDRVAHRIAGSTYRSTDLTHWLALDTATAALSDAGFRAGEGLPRPRTGVVVGNTLTGEFSRANVMRLRWPYVRRVLAAALKGQDWEDERLADFLDGVEDAYKKPFPAIDEDTLAGGLSNTIAGRICNHFDLGGGGYTVDGACSSSLLSVTTAAGSLVGGDLDVVVAGGVDLSIDPFEIIGFAKTGALARKEMRLYDRGSNGFWPGEGCGMVVLMREEDALAQGRRVYATVAGWGIASDGQGGITRPEVSGYQLAMSRAYDRAGFGVGTVPLFEGHGTGTAVGDATELRAIMGARAADDPTAPHAAITSVKGMIGHTKAAAGIAGLIKATMAVDAGVLPPAIGCVDPHELLTADGANLRVLRKAEAWPDGAPLRAAVTAMGFGGINTHVVLDKTPPKRRTAPSRRTTTLAGSLQDAELLLLDGDSPQALRARAAEVGAFAAGLSYAQLGDLAATLQRELRELPYRAAVVTTSPDDAELRLRHIVEALDEGALTLPAGDGRTLLGRATDTPRIGFLFPGQGSGHGTGGGALRRRFTEAAEVYERAALPAAGDMVATGVAQPRIVTGSTAGLRVLESLGIEADVAVGHSLGELSALHWAGALDAPALLEVARVRGRTMAEHSASGTMASIAAAPDTATSLAEGLPVVIAGFNSPGQTVLAGPVDAVEAVAGRAARAGVTCTRLAVSHAFHSPLVAPAADSFGDWITGVPFGAVDRRIVSTVTGEDLRADSDLPKLLHRQITDPVLFAQAVKAAAEDVDLFVEVGPGRVLSALTAAGADVPAVALDTDSESLRPLLQVVGAAYVAGAPLIHERLFNDRLTRPLEIGATFDFLSSPCEQAPEVTLPAGRPRAATAAEDTPDAAATPDGAAGGSALDVLRALVAERAELPPELVGDDISLIDELHMSSITVGQLVNQAAGRLGIAAAHVPTNFATATLIQLAEALETLADTAGSGPAGPTALVTGAAPWARPFAVDLEPVPLPPPPPAGSDGAWELYAPREHPYAQTLRQELERSGTGAGVLVWLPSPCPPEALEQALTAARSALAGDRARRFVLVQDGPGAAGLAKSLHLEAPHLRTTVVHTPATADSVARVLAEVAATTVFTEVHYDTDGTRRVPTLSVLPYEPARTEQVLDASDVLLVTGGAKGITAECALALAKETGARLALIGRSDPAEDPDVAANLRRMTDSGITVGYARADVTDPAATAEAVAALTGELGPVTAVLHGAGRNEPAALTALTADDFRRTFAPKVGGLHAVLGAVDQGALKLLVTFGSIIGRAGLRGEAHYATANEWLAAATEQVARDLPHCRALCLEWSVWSGVGMGEKLSVVESLTREGITPVTPDQGIEILLRLVRDPDAPVVSVVSGRTEGIETVRRALPPLPLLRFTGNPLVRYHGVELVTEVELNPGTDLYLAGHLLDGNLLLPAVLGMEAMVQVASAVTGRDSVPVIEDVRFLRPVVVPPGGSTRIRVAATVTGPDTVAVALHSAETGFAAEHFRGRLRYTRDLPVPDGPPAQTAPGLPDVPLDPAGDLYGGILFQGERFQRLRTFHRAAARHVDADVAIGAPGGWFAGFLPGTLLLADPGMRDALMHGNQVCVPDATLLPSGIERLYPLAAAAELTGELRYCATERYRDGDTYVYDIAVRTPDGTVVERWEGLTLHAVRKTDGQGPWVAPLLGSYLERTVEEVLGTRIAIAVEPDPAGHDPSVTGRRAATALALGRALGEATEVRYRPDGRPELPAGPQVSAAHGAGVTLGAVSDRTVACDVEAVETRTGDQWAGLLGEHAGLAALVAEESGEEPDTAATRVWSAAECLRKAGILSGAPLTAAPATRDNWVTFTSGGLRIATFATTLRGLPAPVVLAFLTDAPAPAPTGPSPS
ncbi:type I polyketide synthase [Streptomyces sp. NBC_00249]|uniref:type I polyketide synthase n=1 Tax=Streptomyces sp. NBC_00249 TaxID=2975690 RepID=UPI00225632EB|nr:type I polyketide synthase [Streptomyces sp. NBC_00249]MCX5199550.1 type I polyketide synthase [Streptomyces sp. NBC_00249]